MRQLASEGASFYSWRTALLPACPRDAAVVLSVHFRNAMPLRVESGRIVSLSWPNAPGFRPCQRIALPYTVRLECKPLTRCLSFRSRWDFQELLRVPYTVSCWWSMCVARAHKLRLQSQSPLSRMRPVCTIFCLLGRLLQKHFYRKSSSSRQLRCIFDCRRLIACFRLTNKRSVKMIS